VGTTCSEVLPPEGSWVSQAEGTIYRGELHIPVHIGDRDYVYRYDGATFNRVLEIPAGRHAIWLSVRGGKLLILGYDDVAYEYDGTVLVSIQSPGHEVIYASHESTFCHHTWTLLNTEAISPDARWSFAIETPDSTCVIPGGSAPIIPGRLGEYERVTIEPYGRERDWCWTGIDVSWVINPICALPPCIPYSVQTTLTDSQGKTVWNRTFDKPFSTSFSMEDKPYALSVSVEKDKTFEQVLLMDQNLVNNGIESVSFDMYPKEDYFYFTVNTKKQQQVPITLTLRNTKGESLWQEKFTAPLDKYIRAFVEKPGDYLQVSLQQQTSGVMYYPNPFKENLTLEVAEGTAPVSISLSDLNGKVMFQSKLPGPGKHSVNVGSLKSGLYILTIVEGNLTRRELVKIE